MLLCIDIGNTNIKFAILEDYKVMNKYVISVNQDISLIIKNAENNLKISFENTPILIASVKQECLSNLLLFMNNKYSNKNVFVLKSCYYDNIVFSKNKDISHIGVDIVVKSAWAKLFNKKSTLILDMGTATVVHYTKEDGLIEGASIAPGIYSMLNSLNTDTALIPKIDFSYQEKLLHNNTVECVQSGVFWGYIGMINQLLSKAISEIYPQSIIITGGGAKIFAEYLIEDTNFKNIPCVYDENILLKGMYCLYQENIEMFKLN